MKILFISIRNYLAPFWRTTVLFTSIVVLLTSCDQNTEKPLTIVNYGVVEESGTAAAVHDHTGSNSSDSKKSLIYGCPMNCIDPMEKPGRCPVCGMDLVAIHMDDHQHRDRPPSVTLSAEKIRGAGIQTAPVEQKFVDAEIPLFGRIEYDPVQQYKVTAFAPGIIDRIYVQRAGQMVRAGDPLFDMHSSELFVLEQDLFEELKQFPDSLEHRPGKGDIYKRQMMRPPRRQLTIPKLGKASVEEIKAKKAALEKIGHIQRKMLLLGLEHEDIERVMARGRPTGISTVVAPTSGIVQEQFAFKGSYVNTGETIFTIANPRYVWAKLDGYATDFPWIKLGQEAQFKVDAHPGETFRGKVNYLDPEFDPQTRTFKVGVFYSDPGRRLRPNMLVRCVIRSRLKVEGAARAHGGHKENKTNKAPLVIPDSAPLITGNRAVVYVEDPNKPGTYEGREIVLGPRSREHYVVTRGLEKGEMVVVNGNFKIDSAVQIMARPSMMTPGKPMDMESADKQMHQMTTMPMPKPPAIEKQVIEKPAPARNRSMIKERRREHFSKLRKSRSGKSTGQSSTKSRQKMSPKKPTGAYSIRKNSDSAASEKNHEHHENEAPPVIERPAIEKPAPARDRSMIKERRREHLSKLRKSRSARSTGQSSTKSRQKMLPKTPTGAYSIRKHSDSAAGQKNHEHHEDEAPPAVQMEHRDEHTKEMHQNMKDK